ncbi:MAG: GWxTD domain-containing protein [Gemmatimonadaceae bacterium]
MRNLRHIFACILTLVLVRRLPAQDSARLIAQAESLAALGESARAFAVAVEATSHAASSARAWLVRGLSAAAQRPFPMGRFGLVAREFSELQREAIRSLQRAVQLAPDSARYWVELGVVQALSSDSALRRQARESLERGRDLAVLTRDGPVLARANEAIGWWYWRRFEQEIVYLPASPESHNELRAAAVTDSSRRDSLLNFLEWGHGWQSDYLDATEHFERAVFADSANARARYHVLRSLVTFERWEDLLQVAQQQVRDVGWDAWSWLALGLAQLRHGNRIAASAAFDSAIAHCTAREREYLLDASRIITPDAAASYRSQLPALREAGDRFYWLHSDPLWLVPGNMRWVEFLGRLTFAELRWGVPELGLRGLDTDQGRVYVRFGSPTRIAGADTSRLGVPHITWSYRGGVRLRFIAQPLLGVAQLDPESETALRELAVTTPVAWSAAANDEYSVRDVAVQTAAFFPRRSDDRPADSLSVVVLVPNVPAQPTDAAVFLADRAGRAERMPTARSAVLAGDSAWSAYEARAPGVSAYVRFEVRDTVTRAASRAAAEIAPLADHVLHVSDIMVARCLTNRDQRPARWFEARIALTATGSCAPDRLVVFWEEGTTEPGIGGGTARITVRSSIEDDLATLMRMAADPRAASLELRALGSSESTRGEGGTQRGNREVSLAVPLAPVRGRARLRYVELSLRAVKRSGLVVTLTRSIPGGPVVTRERRVPWH